MRLLSSRMPSIMGAFIREGLPSIIIVAISGCRCMQARCRGVLPSSCCVMTAQLLLPSSSSSAISRRPWLAAQCSGVGPLSAGWQMLPRLAPFSLSICRTKPTCPC